MPKLDNTMHLDDGSLWVRVEEDDGDMAARLLEPPLDDRERKAAAGWSSDLYRPGVRYVDEAELEEQRIAEWASRDDGNPDTRDFFIKPAGKNWRPYLQRRYIIARHNIKRRWQKLGVWNPEWGIPAEPVCGGVPGLRPYELRAWQWRWEIPNADENRDAFLERDPEHPTTLAFRQRCGLRRSQHARPAARSHVQDDTPASQAEAFIASRPWFHYAVEEQEETERAERLPCPKAKCAHPDKCPVAFPYCGCVDQAQRVLPGPSIRERWEEKGDWKATWSGKLGWGFRRGWTWRDESPGKPVIGWTWRDESPSPEPEDLARLDNMSTFGLTPSETDALEAIPSPGPASPNIFSGFRRSQTQGEPDGGAAETAEQHPPSQDF